MPAGLIFLYQKVLKCNNAPRLEVKGVLAPGPRFCLRYEDMPGDKFEDLLLLLCEDIGDNMKGTVATDVPPAPETEMT